MHSTLILAALCAAPAVSAGFVPAFINTERGVLAAAGMASLISADCRCWADNTGASGTHVGQGAAWYQCAYPTGSCTWDDLGFLVNSSQANCPKLATCVPH